MKTRKKRKGDEEQGLKKKKKKRKRKNGNKKKLFSPCCLLFRSLFCRNNRTIGEKETGGGILLPKILLESVVDNDMPGLALSLWREVEDQKGREKVRKKTEMTINNTGKIPCNAQSQPSENYIHQHNSLPGYPTPPQRQNISKEGGNFVIPLFR